MIEHDMQWWLGTPFGIIYLVLYLAKSSWLSHEDHQQLKVSNVWLLQSFLDYMDYLLI
jgi:hypothetical protein